ncbi:MAG: hypothetical protein E7158_05880 [Firmicutes bacterium]|nr:hypothetical protein [Bacillota bacterium]
MKDLTKKIFWTSIVSTIAILIFGALLFTFPETVIKSITIALAVIFIAVGIIPIINYFRFRSSGISTTFGFMMGVFCIIVGLILLMNENILNIIIPIITGVWIIINAINRIAIAMDLRDLKVGIWSITLIYAIITLVIGVLLILDPVNGGKLVTKTVGVIIMCYSMLDLVELILVRLKVKAVVSTVKNEVKKIIEEE